MLSYMRGCVYAKEYKKCRQVNSGSFLFRLIKFIIVSSPECNVAWCFWHKMYMYHVPATNMKWKKKGFANIFPHFIFFSLAHYCCCCNEKHRRILIRYLLLTRFLFCKVITWISLLEKNIPSMWYFPLYFLNVPCAYLLHFSLSSLPPNTLISSSSSSTEQRESWRKRVLEMIKKGISQKESE